MLGRFEYADADVLFDLCQKALPEKYALTPALLKTHLLEAPTLDFEASRWLTFNQELISFCAVKRSPAELFPGPNPLQSHIGLLCFRDFEAARQVLDEVVPNLRSRGIQRLIFGQDSRHFFPGCPLDWPEMMRFLTDRGFQEETDQVDLERDISAYEAPEGALAPLDAEGIEARPCKSEDLPLLNGFFTSEFPGRWHYDVIQKWNQQGPETVLGLFENGACVGFALLQQDGCSVPTGGAVWGVSLGAGWGSMGPIGVSKSVRGRGLGDALLAAALLELKKRGARRTIIDWTTLIEFYCKHGFEVARRYKTMALDLTQS